MSSINRSSGGGGGVESSYAYGFSSQEGYLENYSGVLYGMYLERTKDFTDYAENGSFSIQYVGTEEKEIKFSVALSVIMNSGSAVPDTTIIPFTISTGNDSNDVSSYITGQYGNVTMYRLEGVLDLSPSDVIEISVRFVNPSLYEAFLIKVETLILS